MKLPKNRANVYVVIRYPSSHASSKDGVPIGVFSSYEDADEYAGACAQELQEKIGYGMFYCTVMLTSFYG